MPTRFVGLHLAIAAVFALTGLSFIADPCPGGSDLCLGGVVGLYALGIAGLGGIGIGVWLVGRRASPLLVWDAVTVTITAFIAVFSGGSGSMSPVALGAMAAVFLGIPAGVLAGKEVAAHRLERLLAVAALAGFGVLAGAGGAAIFVLGSIALGIGWLLARRPAGEAAQAA